MKKYVIIVAGGTGERMNSEIPKQFLLLNELPVLMRTILAFYNHDSNIDIILVLPEDHILYWKNICPQYNFTVKHRIVHGGQTRFHSVKNGLELVSHKQSLVAVHDGVRPLVSQATIQTCFDTAAIFGNAVPVVEIFESLRVLENNLNKSIDRTNLRIIQTPQVFKADQILGAYLQEFLLDFTDDASVIESTGKSIHLVSGNRENIKITTAQDLIIASALIEKF